MLEVAKKGRDALLVAATGSGKTLAGFLPAICDLIEAKLREAVARAQITIHVEPEHKAKHSGIVVV